MHSVSLAYESGRLHDAFGLALRKELPLPGQHLQEGSHLGLHVSGGLRDHSESALLLLDVQSVRLPLPANHELLPSVDHVLPGLRCLH